METARFVRLGHGAAVPRSNNGYGNGEICPVGARRASSWEPRASARQYQTGAARCQRRAPRTARMHRYRLCSLVVASNRVCEAPTLFPVGTQRAPLAPRPNCMWHVHEPVSDRRKAVVRVRRASVWRVPPEGGGTGAPGVGLRRRASPWELRALYRLSLVIPHCHMRFQAL